VEDGGNTGINSGDIHVEIKHNKLMKSCYRLVQNIFVFFSVIKYWLARAGRSWGSKLESRYGQEFSLLHFVQTGSGDQPGSHSMDNRGSFHGSKVPSSASSLYITPSYIFMA
jgi:hypothetical protein